MSQTKPLAETPQLVESVRRGDDATLREVVAAYLPQVLRAARAAGLSAQDAEDVTQDTFMTFLQRAQRFEGRSQVRTWIFGILYRKILESRRQSRREEPFERIDEVFDRRFGERGQWVRPPRPPDQAAFDRGLREHLGECLDGLPERHRLTFVLREIEGLSSDEICKILDVTRTNLGVMFHRARNALRECLEGKGFQGSDHAELS